MDDHQAIDASPDGMFLAQWCELHRVGRSVGFGLLRCVQSLNITVERARPQGSTKPAAFLSGAALKAMDTLVSEFKAGASLPSIEAKYSASIVPSASADHAAAIVATADDPEPSSDFDPASLLQRLEAAKLAIQTGMPLRANEAAWILGGSCNSAHVRKARLRVMMHAHGSYSICAPLVD